MSNNYQRIPTSDNDNSTHPEPSTAQDDPSDPSYRPLRASVRAEFERPAPSWWKRALLLFALVLMGWAAVRLGSYGRDTQPKVIYATRYSDEHRYRPAASPVITEYLKDGRIRLRGASVGGVGIREEDLPMTPERKALEEKKRVEAAREAAREKLALKKKEARKAKVGKRKRGRKVKTEM